MPTKLSKQTRLLGLVDKRYPIARTYRQRLAQAFACAPPPGAVIGAVAGGFIGGFGGSYVGGFIGGSSVNYYHNNKL